MHTSTLLAAEPRGGLNTFEHAQCEHCIVVLMSDEVMSVLGCIRSEQQDQICKQILKNLNECECVFCIALNASALL
jgi:hypothetical protein